MIRNIRIRLFAVTVVLVCIGIVMIYSASSIYAWERYKDSFFFLKRHVSFIIIGITLAFLSMSVDYRKFRRYCRPLLLVSLLLLVLGGVLCLILLQPDLGTIIALGSVALIMLFIAGVRMAYLFSLVLLSLP